MPEQTPYNITGKVKNASGTYLPDVRVTAFNITQTDLTSTTTAEDGSYSFDFANMIGGAEYANNDSFRVTAQLGDSWGYQEGTVNTAVGYSDMSDITLDGESVDAFTETAFVSISPQGGTDVEFSPIVDTIDIAQGDKVVETVNNVRGGRISLIKPEEDTEITFEAYPVSIDTSDGTGMAQFFHTTQSNYDTSEPLAVNNSILKDKFRVTILWTNDPNVTIASGAPTYGYLARRWYALDCNMVSCKTDFTDMVHKATFVFKVKPFTKTGTGRITEESSGFGSALTALGSYS